MGQTYMASLCYREWKVLVFGRGSFLKNLKAAMDAYASGD